ncbi:thiamine biosynthesis protein ApbE [Fulvimonas soli]|uniref:FAD:protein FMN transferase n=2 Tax=Fulvimonas soli TaxID=155197 RepID=A0A316IGG0_9GAMM|nr:FAD:protein FMN transferase [Fulvimonas soli]PWK92119.1 thiamine biosynthesis lipoprotein [Fulvimonas soli]TNY27848.1 thiamine biosynthesis protein ApbE [Fulvimonas soli]
MTPGAADPAAAPALHALAGETMGTTWSVRLVAPAGTAPEPLRRGVQDQLDAVDAQMSTYKPHSALSRFNAAPAGSWHALPEACFRVMAHALRVAEDTDGAYDPTVGPLVNLWGFGPDARGAQPPAREAVEAARRRVGWQRIRLDPAQRRAWQPGGACVDLSSVAKGYAVDRVGQWLDAAGIRAWLVEVGGEFKGRGRKPDGTPWRVGIERPPAGGPHEAERFGHVIALDGRAVATSGDYRRHYTVGGTRVSHHIDPRTGLPVPTAVASVSVLADEAMHADPLGTALTVLGAERGLAYAQARGLAALFILRGAHGFEERMTPAFAAALAA